MCSQDERDIEIRERQVLNANRFNDARLLVTDDEVLLENMSENKQQQICCYIQMLNK
jgi:hypothetical protein